MTKVFIDHLEWQPTARCIKNCLGCYVKKDPQPVKNAVPKGIYLTEEIVPQQFTISLDTVLPGTVGDLVKTLRWIWKKQQEVENPPELCITAADVDTVKIWSRELDISPANFLKPVSILSLSKFPVQGKQCEDLVKLCKETDTTLNYNCKINKVVVESKRFELGLRYSDMAYLVIEKGPLGRLPNIEALKVWIEASKIEDPKVILDRCAGWASANEETCGACSHIIHIWPGNTVSGCPYDSNYKVAIQEVGTITQKIERVQQLGSKTFSHCKLRKLLKRK